MKGYEKYINNLESCLHTVEEALEHGVLLTRTEKFDYEFKKALYLENYSSREFKKSFLKSFTDKDVKLAQVYAQVFDSLVELVAAGFSYSDAAKFAEMIIKKANRAGLNPLGISVKVSDLNGVLYLRVICNHEVSATFEVVDRGSLFLSMLAVVSYIGESYSRDEEFREFVSACLLNVYVEIRAGKIPKPYIYKDIAKTLGNFISKKNTVVSEENSKIIMLGKAM